MKYEGQTIITSATKSLSKEHAYPFASVTQTSFFSKLRRYMCFPPYFPPIQPALEILDLPEMRETAPPVSIIEIPETEKDGDGDTVISDVDFVDPLDNEKYCLRFADIFLKADASKSSPVSWSITVLDRDYERDSDTLWFKLSYSPTDARNNSALTGGYLMLEGDEIVKMLHAIESQEDRNMKASERSYSILFTSDDSKYAVPESDAIPFLTQVLDASDTKASGLLLKYSFRSRFFRQRKLRRITRGGCPTNEVAQPPPAVPHPRRRCFTLNEFDSIWEVAE